LATKFLAHLCPIFSWWSNIALPPDWDLRESALKDAKNYWPMEQLKNAARLPIWCDTWLGYAPTMSNDEANSPFADNTKLCSVIRN
jgi:hypothetical protein